MTAEEIIDYELPDVSYVDNCENVLILMDEYKVSDLAVVHEGNFLGLVSEDDILNVDKTAVPINAADLDFKRISISPTAHLLDILKQLDEYQLSLAAVVNGDGVYLGSISRQTILQRLAEVTGVRQQGGVIILEMHEADYSLSQIGQIVEGNDAKVLSANMRTIPGSMQIEVILKVNQEDLNAILQTFSRYNYTVKAFYQKPQYTDSLKERYEEMMKYLNM